MAAYLALQKLRIPQTELTIGKNQITQELEEFEIVPDFSKTLALDFSQIPILVSITKVELLFMKIIFFFIFLLDWKIFTS